MPSGSQKRDLTGAEACMHPDLRCPAQKHQKSTVLLGRLKCPGVGKPYMVKMLYDSLTGSNFLVVRDGEMAQQEKALATQCCKPDNRV